MSERSWQRARKPRDRSRDEAIDRRALEIMERRRCDWVEAWARALAEQRRVDELGDVDSEEPAPARRRINRAGRVTLSEQIGRANRPRSNTVSPGRKTRSATLPATVMRSAERTESFVNSGTAANPKAERGVRPRRIATDP